MDQLYNNLKNKQNQLINNYQKNGFIRFDIATGLAYFDEEGNIQQRVKFIKQFDQFGNLILNNDKPLLKKTIDFDEIKKFNISEGIESGKMIDALKERAKDKTVTLYANDQCLRWGTILLGDVPCLLKIMENINFVPYDLMPIFKSSNENSDYIFDENTLGLVHSLNDKIEKYALFERGSFKSYNYKGDAEFLSNPISLWSHTDLSRLSTSIFGTNSLIRIWGDNQCVDLNGKELSIMENTNIVSGFSNIFNLSDGHFDKLSTKGSNYTFIYNSSEDIARIGRSNHFGIVGNKCKNILVENIHFGDIKAKNKGAYFGSAIFNKSSNIIFKNVIQEQLNHNVTRSGLGLNWYTDLITTEIILGKLIRVDDWNYYKEKFKWLKWEKKNNSNFENGMKTLYPEIKSIEELANDMNLDDANLLYKYMIDADNAYNASSKNADDHSIQVDVLHNNNAKKLTNGRLLNNDQVSRTTNLVVANALNKDEMNLYPDSVSYGFRAGNSEIGIGNLAKNKSDNPSTNIYIIDSIFNEFSVSFMESISILNNNGLVNCLHGNHLKLFGHSNNRNPSAGIASSTMFLSCKKLNKLFDNNGPESLPYKILKPNSSEFALDTAQMAFDNANLEIQKSWINSENLQGLYKGNDVIEHSLAIISLMSMLQKVYPDSSKFLESINNSKLDVGILAWRKSMLNAIKASTASNIGLTGGYLGDITDNNPGQSTKNTSFDGEIYPWYYSNKKSNFKKYNAFINNEEKYTLIEIDKDFHHFSKNNIISININNNKILKKIVKIISSTKFLIEKIDYNFDKTKLYEIYYKYNLKISETIIDKDQDYFNTKDKINHKRETVENKYLASSIPYNNDNLLKLNLEYEDEGMILRLVRSKSGKKVTYRECASLVGFENIGKKKIDNLDNYVSYNISQNLDGQNHVHKGVFGIRLDQIKDATIKNCKITNIESIGFAQETNITGNDKILNDNDITQPWRPDTQVNTIHAISINGCENINIENIINENFNSLGNIYGVEINGESEKINISNIENNNFLQGSLYNEKSINKDLDPFNLSFQIFNNNTFHLQESIGVNTTDCKNNNIEFKKIKSNSVNAIKKKENILIK